MSQQKHSLVFCPKCGTLLDPPSGTDDNIDCHACGNTVAASLFEAQKVFTQSRPEAFPNRPKIDKIVDKYAHLKDGATIQEKCTRCGNNEMVFHTAQLRSADEGQTVFYNCVKCGYKYSINS